MKIINKAILLIIGFAFVTGCGFHKVRGNGNIVEKEYNVSNFRMLDASGAFDIKVHFADKPDVKVITDSNLMKYVKVSVDDKTLYLSTRKNVSPTKKLLVEVTTSQLNGVDLSGANTLTANGIKTDMLSLDISGAAEATLSGRADLFKVDLSGAAELNAKELITKTTKIQVSGAANAAVNVTSALYADVSGAADLTYFGSPTLINQEVSGAGSIRKK